MELVEGSEDAKQCKDQVKDQDKKPIDNRVSNLNYVARNCAQLTVWNCAQLFLYCAEITGPAIARK